MEKKIIIQSESDKQYWHRYLPAYENALKRINNVNKILEFGIFKGDSIRWLNNKYPNSKIFASDILPIQEEWPTNENISYLYVDQGNLESINILFNQIATNLDIIIEDGSHFPEHQKNCLVEGIKKLNPGGLYILEDLHTSHPEHIFYKQTSLKFLNNWQKFIFRIFQFLPFSPEFREYLNRKLLKNSSFISTLNLLLCLEHLKINKMDLNENILTEFNSHSLYTADEVKILYEKISSIEIFKRSELPHKCYSCGSKDYNYTLLKCKCGEALYSNCDSIAALIQVK